MSTPLGRGDVLRSAQEWITLACEDPDMAAELTPLLQNNDLAGLSERFAQSLEFGTGGLRGMLGAGTNRMNVYTVSQATQGLANHLKRTPAKTLRVAIAYDSRAKSALFARHAARVLAANNITALLYPRLMPTPALSFAVRQLGCTAGICITASHNPAVYNGFKVYGADGCQITDAAATAIQAEIRSVALFSQVNKSPFSQALAHGAIRYIDETTTRQYLEAVWKQRLSAAPNSALSVVYTPLHGTGLECITHILKRAGVCNVQVVPEQAYPDEHFSTCPSPNPENEEAMELGMRFCVEKKMDLLLATDPDCDRVGVAVREGAHCTLLSGNEVGILLLEYICRKRTENGTMPPLPLVVKSIVTTDMAEPVCQEYGVELRNVLTGFKYIGETIAKLENEGQSERYIFGFEESCGYLSGRYVRDKDAVNASLLISDMAGEYKQRGLTLLQAMEQLYRKYGYYTTHLDTVSFAGEPGMAAMRGFMQSLRSHSPVLEGFCEPSVRDYFWHTQEQAPLRGAPPSDVLEYRYGSDVRITVRPSGTEPKLKIYYSVKGKSRQAATQTLRRLQKQISALLCAYM